LKKNGIKTRISSSWRNYSIDTDKFALKRTPQSSTKADLKESPIKVKADSVVPSSKGVGAVAPPPRASKLQNNYKALSKKFNKQVRHANIEEILMHDRHNDHPNANELWEKLYKEDYKKYKKLMSFNSAHGLCKNLDPAPANKFNLDKKGIRRLSTDFARIISKIAEDNSGEVVDGSQIWDVDKLLSRRLDNRSLTHCKSKEELECLILILDSSPSCSRYAKMYSQIASIAAEFDDVDMFNAPNARILYKYNIRKRKFVKCFSSDDVMNGADKWNYFKNRTILFFGDSDGVRIVAESTNNNNIHWFTPLRSDIVQDDIKNDASHIIVNTKNLTIYPRVNSIKSFIKAIKNMK